MSTPTGRSVLVTGASRGIGRAIALAFAAAGDRVAVHYRSGEQAARQTFEELGGDGHVLVQGDVAVPEEARRVVHDAARRLDGLDVVVNNAGIYREHAIAEVDADEWLAAWRQVLDTNLLGPAMICHAAAEVMRPARVGRIINVSSRGAFRGEPRGPAYGASKAGLNAMSQSLAVALAPHGIFVAVVAPGFIATDMAEEILNGPEGDAIRAQSPLQRVGRAEEVARTVFFLTQDGIEYATGAIVDVNGASYLRS